MKVVVAAKLLIARKITTILSSSLVSSDNLFHSAIISLDLSAWNQQEATRLKIVLGGEP